MTSFSKANPDAAASVDAASTSDKGGAVEVRATAREWKTRAAGRQFVRYHAGCLIVAVEDLPKIAPVTSVRIVEIESRAGALLQGFVSDCLAGDSDDEADKIADRLAICAATIDRLFPEGIRGRGAQ